MTVVLDTLYGQCVVPRCVIEPNRVICAITACCRQVPLDREKRFLVQQVSTFLHVSLYRPPSHSPYFQRTS